VTYVIQAVPAYSQATKGAAQNNQNANSIGKWKYIVETDPMTDEKAIAFSLKSNNNAGGSIIRQPMKMTAIYNCENEHFFIVLETGFIPDGFDSHTEKLLTRYDNDKAVELKCYGSQTGETIYFFEPVTRILDFAKHNTFMIRINAFRDGVRDATFDLRGLKTCITRLENATGKKLVPSNYDDMGRKK
jgi:hypothetical protein